MGYPYVTGKEIVEKYEKKNGRFVGVIKQVFYLRKSHLIKIFCNNQKVWNALKCLVRNLKRIMPSIEMMTPQEYFVMLDVLAKSLKDLGRKHPLYKLEIFQRFWYHIRKAIDMDEIEVDLNDYSGFI